MYSLPEISALVLKEMKAIAESYARPAGDAGGRSPSPPTSTTTSARPPRTPAASPASTCCGILNEPTAAALAYGFGRGRHASGW